MSHKSWHLVYICTRTGSKKYLKWNLRKLFHHRRMPKSVCRNESMNWMYNSEVLWSADTCLNVIACQRRVRSVSPLHQQQSEQNADWVQQSRYESPSLMGTCSFRHVLLHTLNLHLKRHKIQTCSRSHLSNYCQNELFTFPPVKSSESVSPHRARSWAAWFLCWNTGELSVQHGLKLTKAVKLRDHIMCCLLVLTLHLIKLVPQVSQLRLQLLQVCWSLPGWIPAGLGVRVQACGGQLGVQHSRQSLW